MFRLYGFTTQNSLKALYVLDGIEAEFEFVFTDLSSGVQRSEDFLAMNPVGKVPVLDHDGKYLFESGAICRYAANVTGSEMYPATLYERAIVDQWLDYFSCHPGRWLMQLFFQQVIKPKFGMGDANVEKVEEATRFAAQQLAVVDRQLSDTDWLANGRCSIADLCAYAYVEQERDTDFSLDEFPNVVRWYERVAGLDAIARAKSRLPS